MTRPAPQLQQRVPLVGGGQPDQMLGVLCPPELKRPAFAILAMEQGAGGF